MSFQVTRWAIQQPGLSPAAKLLLIVLADHCNGDSGACWPSQTLLAARCGVSERHVRTLVGELQAAGMLTSVRRGRKGGGRGSNRYAFPPEALQFEAADRAEPALHGCQANRNHSAALAEKTGTTVPDQSGIPVPVWGGQSGTTVPVQTGTTVPMNQELEPGRGGTERDYSARVRARAAVPAAAKTLSQAPPVAWLEIAGELRPDLPDPERVHRKFAVHHDGAAYAPPEWARLWRLWLLREHAEAARPGAPSAERTARRAPGAFLDAAPALFAGGDLSTSYEVLRNDR